MKSDQVKFSWFFGKQKKNQNLTWFILSMENRIKFWAKMFRWRLLKMISGCEWFMVWCEWGNWQKKMKLEAECDEKEEKWRYIYHLIHTYIHIHMHTQIVLFWIFYNVQIEIYLTYINERTCFILSKRMDFYLRRYDERSRYYQSCCCCACCCCCYNFLKILKVNKAQILTNWA